MTYSFVKKTSIISVMLIACFVLLSGLQTKAQSATPVISSISPSSVTLNSEGFYITVIGSNFGDLASDVKFNDSVKNTSFISSTQLKAYIPSSDLTTPGTYNITVVNGTQVSNTITFRVISPTPRIDNISPISNTSSLTYNGQFFNLTINGIGFIPPVPGPNIDSGSIVKFNNESVTTRYLSQNQLVAEVSVSNLSNSGNYTVNVTNPAPGGVSNNQIFTVAIPAPTITEISPDAEPVGTPGATITVTGTNFSEGSIARFNGSNRETTFNSNTSIKVFLPQSDLDTMGYYQLNVLNTDGKTSNNYTIRVYKERYECNPDTQQCQLGQCSVGNCQDLCSPLDNVNITCFDYLTITNKTYDYHPYTFPGPDADFWYIISGYPAPANPWVLVRTTNGWGESRVPVFKNASYTILQHPPDEDDWKLNAIQGAVTFKTGNQNSILAASGVGAGGTVIFTNSYVAKGKLKIVLQADGEGDRFDFLVQHSKNGSYFYDWTDKNITITSTDTANYPSLEPGRQDGEKEIELSVDTNIDSDQSYLDYKVIGNLSDGWIYDSIVCEREDGRSVGKRDGKIMYSVPIEPRKTTTCYFQVHQRPSTLKIITNLNGNIDRIKDSSPSARPIFSYNIAGIRENNSYYPLPYQAQVQISNFPAENASQGLAPRPADATGPWGWGSQEISVDPGMYYIQQNSMSDWDPSSVTCFQTFQEGQALSLPPSPQLTYVCFNANTEFAQCGLCNGDWCRNNPSCNPNSLNSCTSQLPPPTSASLAVLNQKHFRIYRDNYILNLAEPYAPQDSNFNTRIGSNFRIRFQIANTGTEPANITRRLEFKEDFGPWTTITNNSNNVRLADSINFVDGNNTTSRLSATGTFLAGDGKDTSPDAVQISLTNGKYTEDEYSLRFQATAAGHNYYFRITNAGVPLNIYSATPYISVSPIDVGTRIFIDEKGYLYQKCQLGNPQNSNESNCCSINKSVIYKDERKNNVDYGNPQSCAYVTWGLLNPLGVGGRYLSQFNIPLPSNDGVVQLPVVAGGKTVCIFNNLPPITGAEENRGGGGEFENPIKGTNPEAVEE